LSIHPKETTTRQDFGSLEKEEEEEEEEKEEKEEEN